MSHDPSAGPDHEGADSHRPFSQGPDRGPLPDDWVAPDDASSLDRDRAAHRMSGLPTLDPIVVRVILALGIGFVSTFAMFMGFTSRMMACETKAECVSAYPGAVPAFLVLFTPVMTAALVLVATMVVKSRRLRGRLLLGAIALPIVCAIVYFMTL